MEEKTTQLEDALLSNKKTLDQLTQANSRVEQLLERNDQLSHEVSSTLGVTESQKHSPVS